MTAPILIFGWGNPSRGDDALGPLFVERIAALQLPGIECLTDFQLQVEHALDLRDRQQVLFVDARVGNTGIFEISSLAPARDLSFSTHAMTPEAVMQVYVDMFSEPPPPCTLLTLRGEHFELGQAPSPTAEAALGLALEWAQDWLIQNCL